MRQKKIRSGGNGKTAVFHLNFLPAASVYRTDRGTQSLLPPPGNNILPDLTKYEVPEISDEYLDVNPIKKGIKEFFYCMTKSKSIKISRYNTQQVQLKRKFYKNSTYYEISKRN
jgi:hypothetical protein